jgi:hypothetical protein
MQADNFHLKQTQGTSKQTQSTKIHLTGVPSMAIVPQEPLQMLKSATKPLSGEDATSPNHLP